MLGLPLVSGAERHFRAETHVATGAEIIEEVLRQLRFDKQLDPIMASSICIPCDMPLTKPAKPPPMAGENRKFYSCGNEVMKSPWGTAKNPQGDHDGSRIQSS